MFAFCFILRATCASGVACVRASGGASSSKYTGVFSTDTDLAFGFLGARFDATFVLLGFQYQQPSFLCLVRRLIVPHHLCITSVLPIIQLL